MNDNAAWQKEPGNARALRTSVFKLHLEGADCALRQRHRIRIPPARSGPSRQWRFRCSGQSAGAVPGEGLTEWERGWGAGDRGQRRAAPCGPLRRWRWRSPRAAPTGWISPGQPRIRRGRTESRSSILSNTPEKSAMVALLADKILHLVTSRPISQAQKQKSQKYAQDACSRAEPIADYICSQIRQGNNQ